MLFRISNRPVRTDNPELDSVRAFDDLSDRELKWVILVYDYRSPYRQLSFADRKEQAAENAGYKRESAKRLDKSARNLITPKLQEKNLPHIETAVKAFQDMQRDLDFEAMQAYDKNLEDYINKLKEPKKTEKDWNLNLKIVKEYEKLLIGRKRIKEQLDLRGGFEEEQEEQAEEKVLSTLDRVMRDKINQGK